MARPEKTKTGLPVDPTAFKNCPKGAGESTASAKEIIQRYRDDTVAEIRRRTAKFLKDHDIKVASGSCFYHAHFTAEVLHEQDQPVLVQAGSCSWPRLLLEQDDGKDTTLTHFSYNWSPKDAASVESMLAGALPETHIWCALSNTREIVDVTTHQLVEQAKVLTGLDWPGPPPPPYLWTIQRNMPERTLYEPVVAACMLAVRLYLARFDRPAYLEDYLNQRGIYAQD